LARISLVSTLRFFAAALPVFACITEARTLRVGAAGRYVVTIHTGGEKVGAAIGTP